MRKGTGVLLAALPLLLTACGGPPAPGPVVKATVAALGQGAYRVAAVSRFQIQGSGYGERLTLLRQGNGARATVAGPQGSLWIIGNGHTAVTINRKSGVRIPAVLSSGALLPSGADVGLVVLAHLRALFRQGGVRSLPGGTVQNQPVDQLLWKPGPGGFLGIPVESMTAAVNSSSHLPVQIRLVETTGPIVTLDITGFRIVGKVSGNLFRP